MISSQECRERLKETYSITITVDAKETGPWVSTNDIRNKHWRELQKAKNFWRAYLSDKIKKQKPRKLSKYSVVVLFNSRLDTDNVSLKYYCDALKDAGVIQDDNKKFSRSVHIIPDETMKFDTYEISVVEWQG